MANYSETEIETIRENVIDCIADQMGISFDEVFNAKNKDEIGADSLDAVEIVMRLEDEFDTEIKDADFEKFTDIESIVRYLASCRGLDVVKQELSSKKTPSVRRLAAYTPHKPPEPKNALVEIKLVPMKDLFDTDFLKTGADEFQKKYTELFTSGSENILASLIKPVPFGHNDGWSIEMPGRLTEDDATTINQMLSDAGYVRVSVSDHLRATQSSFDYKPEIFSRVHFYIASE